MVTTGGGKCAVRTSRASSVAAESRMRADQVKGVVKVSNGLVSEKQEADDKTENRAPEQKRSSPGPGSAVKRKLGKSESNSVQIVGERSPSQLQKKKNCVDLTDSNRKCKSPVQSQRKKALKSPSDDGDQRSAILISNPRSDLKSSKVEEPLEANGSDPSLGVADQVNSAEEKNSGEEIGGCNGQNERGQSESEKTRSDEEKEDEPEDGVDESEDRNADGNINGCASEENEEEEVDEEIEVQKSISCDEEIVVEKDISCDEKTPVENEKNIFSDEDVVDVVEKNLSDDCEDKEMNETQVNYSISNSEINSRPKFSSNKPTIAIAGSRSGTQFSPVKQQPPKFSRPTLSSPVRRDSDTKHRGPETHSTLQSLVDLVMWKHVPRSALVFGVGTFMIISSAYTKDVNISFISVTSYLGLIYLGISFLYRSFKCRNVLDGNDTSYCHGTSVIGEEEAIWLSRLILPSLNEFLLKLRALFSGDPDVTMKLAAVLFALARCGSSITIWNMVKLGFFTAFILPKFCSSYSAQITGYSKFWILRFQDAWRSCSHKKVVAFAMFTIVWNLSSVVARIWAAFMLFVAIRYYQQSTIKAQTWDDVEVDTGRTSNDDHVLRRRPQPIRKLRQGRPSATPIASTPVNLNEAKKGL